MIAMNDIEDSRESASVPTTDCKMKYTVVNL